MEELVLYIAKHLVNSPEQVEVKSEENNNIITISVKVNSNDLGKIIGRGGRIVNSVRTIVKSISNKTGKKYLIKVGE
ncbi:MAG: KH domain-containing protein [Clostridia bacterium]|nr:KH domain-containing protein [Clostridia bacterium]MDD4686097.1 KH domain-containing protein [Clostridia bacterium]